MTATAEQAAPALGVLHDVPMSEYLSGPGLSKSTLAALLDSSPMHVRRGIRKESDALRMGSLLHCLTLEPEKFGEMYVMEPDLSQFCKKDGSPADSPRATGDYKAAVKELLAANPGREMVTPEDHTAAQKIATAIRSHGVFKNLLGGEPLVEQTIWWEEPVYDEEADERLPILLKARPDAHREREHDVIVVDLKSTKDASPRAFGRQSVNLRYHMSAYMTARAVWEVYKKPVTWIAFAFEKVAPYATASYVYTADALHGGPWTANAEAVATPMHVGKRETHEAAALWRRCEKSGRWPGYNDGKIVPIQIPRWKEKEHEDDEYANAPEEPF